MACLPGRENVAELLLAKGADVNARNNEGSSPLRYAQIWQDPDAVELLRKHGAKE